MTVHKYQINENIEKAKKPVQVHSKTGKIFTQMREEAKKKNATELQDIYYKVFDKFGLRSGSQLYDSDIKVKKDFIKEIESKLKGVKGTLSSKVYDELEDENYHAMNEILAMNGYFEDSFYGGKPLASFNYHFQGASPSMTEESISIKDQVMADREEDKKTMDEIDTMFDDYEKQIDDFKEREIIEEPKMSSEESKEIAGTILQQLGGNRFIAMTGANSFYADNGTMGFKLPKTKPGTGIKYVKIKLDLGKDLYDLSFHKNNGDTIETIPGLFFDQLIPQFEEKTGLATSL